MKNEFHTPNDTPDDKVHKKLTFDSKSPFFRAQMARLNRSSGMSCKSSSSLSLAAAAAANFSSPLLAASAPKDTTAASSKISSSLNSDGTPSYSGTTINLSPLPHMDPSTRQTLMMKNIELEMDMEIEDETISDIEDAE